MLVLSLQIVQTKQMDAHKSVQNFKSFRETKRSGFPRVDPWMLKQLAHIQPTFQKWRSFGSYSFYSVTSSGLGPEA